MRCRLILVMPLLLCLASPAPAGIIFNRKKKPAPPDHVPELMSTLKNDGDENKRLGAIEELRQYDSAANPGLVPAMVQALLTDKKPAVRAEAAQSLGRMRPVSQEVGQALEQALHNDPSMRVRLQARSALMQYHWAGYHAGQGPPPPAGDAAKAPAAATGPQALPPVINTAATPPARLTPQPVSAPPAPLPVVQPVRTTQEPPLAPPAPEKPADKTAARPAGAQRLPQGPPAPPPGDGPSLEPPGGLTNDQ
jgi:hypothetical protein